MLIAWLENVTQSRDREQSPAGRDLKHASAALRTLAME